ncbi:ATPase, AFG1 family protein [Besnoitia besnoiti]|uniref:ATPase, AFG1 family protein n=1 Tax=Besnoitia besnoiti TaxID=94643 RepID=A0A2A9M8S7_BESBE|nr:ATPase, AFG1 family protein [Besnoitia besnoiti]PFH33574.1 ATPase, AFG1 family protein [Besnoitia besnoiti]
MAAPPPRVAPLVPFLKATPASHQPTPFCTPHRSVAAGACPPYANPNLCRSQGNNFRHVRLQAAQSLHFRVFPSGVGGSRSDAQLQDTRPEHLRGLPASGSSLVRPVLKGTARRGTTPGRSLALQPYSSSRGALPSLEQSNACEERYGNATASLSFLREGRRTTSTSSTVVATEEGLAGPEAANILGRLPSYHVKKKDLVENYLEVDPDNPTPLLEYFSALLREGNLEPNDAQKELMGKLQILMDNIEAFNFKSGDPFDPMTARPPGAPPTPSSPKKARKEFRESAASVSASLDEVKEEMAPRLRPAIRGLYIYGGVGQGKTMIMDAFYDCLSVKHKMRIHFHQFMVEVQEKLHRVKAQRRFEDPLFEVAKQVRSRAQVLCFDEFQVVHITDAMILKRLFEFLFSFGAIVVATSNRPPVDLYKGGLNRQRFLPFIDLLLDCCEVFHIETHKDYRLSKLAGSSHGLYFVPERTQHEILKQFTALTKGEQPEPGVVQVAMGRELQVPLMAQGIAQFSFSDLCEASLGTPDFLAVARNFHTVFLSRVPELSDMEQFPNEIRRFIDLIDVLYERHVRVIFDAAAPPLRLMGVTATTKHFEDLRQTLQKKFSTLQAFFELLTPFVAAGEQASYEVETESISENKWIEGAHAVAGVSEETAKHVFEKLDVHKKGVLPLEAFRSGIYFHMMNFDMKRPSEKDTFLFQGRPESLGPPSAVGYELFNEGGSSGAQDVQFAYVRTVSRIRDMISTNYLEAHQQIFKLQDLRLFGVSTSQ